MTSTNAIDISADFEISELRQKVQSQEEKIREFEEIVRDEGWIVADLFIAAIFQWTAILPFLDGEPGRLLFAL